MQIAKPYSRIAHFNEDGDQVEFTNRVGIGLLRKIEWIARISHRSEEAQTATSWERFIRSVVLEHGDWSVVEHAHVTVDTVIDRGITHEWVRHRLFGMILPDEFTQESTRFVNYEKKMPASFVEPPGLSDNVDRAPNGEATELSTRQMWRHAISTSESMYRGMVKRGVTPQIARSVFPNALASRIATTGNLRMWRHGFLMRTTREAHPQVREVMIPLLEEFQAKVPILFEDIVPLSRQVENMRLPR